jgi:hypothetical protein
MAKSKKKATTTVNIAAVQKDIKKMAKDIANDTAPAHNHGELSPGTVRRESPLEQSMGPGKYRDMIHGHNSKNKHVLDRLPFTFPRKKMIRSHLNVLIRCPECDYASVGTEYTVGFTCPQCKKYVSTKNAEAEARGYDPELKVGFRGTASDKLRLEEKRDKKNSH